MKYGRKQVYKVSNKTILLDANHLAHRIKHMSIHSFNGWFPDAWMYMYLNSLFSIASDFTPWDNLILCVDSSASWRKKYYSEYKANRKREDPDMIYSEMFFIYKELRKIISKTLPFDVIVQKSAEGDDIIGVLAKKLKNVVIVSSDKDMHQCLAYGKKVEIYDPIKREYIESSDPDKELFIKLCTGDKGDNVPSIAERTGPVKAGKIHSGEVKMDKAMKKAFKRNQKLIDFNSIPKKLRARIIAKYEKKIARGKRFKPKAFFKFLKEHEMNKTMDKWATLVYELKSYTKG